VGDSPADLCQADLLVVHVIDLIESGYGLGDSTVESEQARAPEKSV